MIYLRKHQLTILQFFFLLLSLPFSGTPFHTAGGDCFSADTFPPTSRLECPLDTGWKFFFAGDDTSTRYIYTGAPDSAETVTVPHVFPCDGSDGTPLQGYGWYFRSVTLPYPLSERELFLHFEGVCL